MDTVYIVVNTDGYDAYTIDSVYVDVAAAQARADEITAKEGPVDYGVVVPQPVIQSQASESVI